MNQYLIIAGTSDIGQATAKRLIAAGHQVHITGREETKVKDIAASLQVPYTQLDASDFNAVLTLFETLQQQVPITGVVNCAGSLLLKPAHLTSEAEYMATLQANLHTAFAVVRAAGKTMSASGGSIVLVSSAVAKVGLANHEAIAAAKAGVMGLALSAAASYAHCGLRFNVVSPGLVATHLTQQLTQNPTMRKVSEGMHALGRLGQPADIAAAISFFLDPDNSWITGQVLGVDGGLSTIRPKAKA